MKKTVKKFSIALVIIDLLLLNAAFFLINYLKRDTFVLSLPYVKLLLSFNFFAFFLSLFTRKFYISRYRNFLNGTLLILKTNVFILYALAIMVVIMGLPAFSRLHIFGTVALLSIFEISLFAAYYLSGGKDFMLKSSELHVDLPSYKHFSLYLLITDFIFITSIFFALNWFKRGTLDLSAEYEKILLLIYGLWLITGLLTRKFERRKYRNFYYAFAPYARAALLMVATMALLVFAFRMFYFSRLQIFGTFLGLLIAEGVFTLSYFSQRVQKRISGDIETVEEVQQVMQQETLRIPEKNGKTHDNRPVAPVREKLQQHYLKSFPQLFKFVDETLRLDQIDQLETMVVDTHTPFNVEVLDNNSLDLFINLHRVNDFRYLNRYFLEVHKKFYNGGFFVGVAETISTHRKRFFSRFPRPFAEIFYPFNFIYRRVIPKLPLLDKIYFTFTRGRNRVLSRAEVLGRLTFCGFRVLACRDIGHQCYYIAQKVKTPSFERNPSYGPLIRLKRIGYGGDVMSVYKFRTMYPYSEFLQEYVYENHKLQDNGKFNDDFRLTEWGKVFRKLFIDELPQFINYFRGDVNLVGVRALSDQYFNLYPQEARELRIQFKPGLIPPYYADMPKSLEEIVASERRYLEAKQKHPTLTDIRYFSKAMYNIVVKKARSR